MWYAIPMTQHVKYAIRKPHPVCGVYFDGSNESLQALTELYLSHESVQHLIEDFDASDDETIQLVVFDKQLGIASFDLSDLYIYVGFWLVSDSEMFQVWSNSDWQARCRKPILSKLSKLKGLFRGN